MNIFIKQQRRSYVWSAWRIAISALCLWIATSTPAATARLDMRITVDAENVTVGDLVSGLSAAERARLGVDAIVFAAAPAPGKTETVATGRAIQAVRAHSVTLDMLPTARHIKITRAGDTIPKRMIESEIGRALRQNGGSATLSAHLSNQAPTLHVPVGADLDFEIVELQYQPRRERFIARLRAPAADPRAPIYEMTGTAYETASLPALTRAIGKGELIDAADVEIIRIRANKSTSGLIWSRGELIGMTPKRYLRPGQPVRTADITPPVVISKGERVTILFDRPGIVLTARGRALENGALGASIRVVNIQTNRTVDTVVSAPGFVRVSPTVSGGRTAKRLHMVSSR